MTARVLRLAMLSLSMLREPALRNRTKKLLACLRNEPSVLRAQKRFAGPISLSLPYEFRQGFSVSGSEYTLWHTAYGAVADSQV